MKKKVLTALLLCVVGVLTASAQNTIESIRKKYQGVQEWIGEMSDNFPSEGIPSEYYHLHVAQNLPGTGPHHENVRMYYGEEDGEEGEVYPPHYLEFVTAKYNFAAREFYEEYLYDDKGNVMFIYALTPDVLDNGDLVPYELRMWFDGKRLLQFVIKKVEGFEDQDGIDIATLRKASFKQEYAGKSIPKQYRSETDRCRERAKRFLDLFKSIDGNTYK